MIYTKNTITWIIVCGIIIFVIYLSFKKAEDFGTNTEAINNIASVYNNGTLTATNINATGTLSNPSFSADKDGIGMNKKLWAAGEIFAQNGLNVTGKLDVNGPSTFTGPSTFAGPVALGGGIAIPIKPISPLNPQTVQAWLNGPDQWAMSKWEPTGTNKRWIFAVPTNKTTNSPVYSDYALVDLTLVENTYGNYIAIYTQYSTAGTSVVKTPIFFTGKLII
jgi:hypothetical protein